MKSLLLLLFTAAVGQNFLLTGFSPDRLTLTRRTFRQTLGTAGFTVAVTVPAAVIASLLAPHLRTDWLAVLVVLLLTSIVTLLLWLAADSLFDSFAADILPLSAALSGLTAPAVVLVTTFRALAFPESLFFSLGASIGAAVASVLLQLALTRIRKTHVSRALDGLPLALVILALLSMLIERL